MMKGKKPVDNSLQVGHTQGGLVRRTLIALGLTLLLAGCSQSSTPDEPVIESPPAESLSLSYGCPGQTEQPEPCVREYEWSPPTAGVAVKLVADPANPDHLAILEWSQVPADSTAPQPQVSIGPGRAAVAVSRDGGLTWVKHFVALPFAAEKPVPLLPEDILWTTSGSLVVAGFTEDDYQAGVISGGIGVASTGRAWVGRSMDDGQTWSTLVAHGSSYEARFTINEVQPGVLVAAWTESRNLVVSWSLDDGATWTTPVQGDQCFQPSTPLFDGGEILVGCQDFSDVIDYGDLIIQAIDPAQSRFHERGVADIPNNVSCTAWGPVQLTDGRLVVASACQGAQLYSSSDGGRSWQLFGPAVLANKTQERGSELDGLTAGPNATVSALVSLKNDMPTIGGCCISDTHWVTWNATGDVLGEPKVADWEFVESVTNGQWLQGEYSLTTGPDRLWALTQSPSAIGWLAIRPETQSA